MAMTFLDKAKSKIHRIGSTAIYRLTSRWDSDFEPIFICGVSGSGTSLIAALLDQNYDVCAAARESARAVSPTSSLFVDATYNYASLSDFLQALYFPQAASISKIRSDCFVLYRKIVRLPKRSPFLIDKAANSHLIRAGKLAQAFPSSRFVFILRNPITTIEGLRRKWELFRNASLEDLCIFWSETHSTFSQQSAAFTDRLIGVTYEDLVDKPAEISSRVANWIGLKARETRFMYQDQENKAGRGLRNVVDGEVVVDPNAEQESLQRMPAKDQDLIKSMAWKTYEDLLRTIER
jgi:hypothetical protein